VSLDGDRARYRLWGKCRKTRLFNFSVSQDRRNKAAWNPFKDSYAVCTSGAACSTLRQSLGRLQTAIAKMLMLKSITAGMARPICGAGCPVLMPDMVNVSYG
jgi:hypothetical protein